jgi:bifunctional non-homologous end joining protein LigD
VQLLTKSGSDCTTWFPEIAEALAMLPGGPHVIDGEVCVLRPDGTSDFNLLQARARRRKPYPGGPQVTLMAFDILVHDGQSVMGRPLVERKALLEQLLQGMPPVWVLFVKDLPADAAVFQAMVAPGLEIEGVMAKRRDSIYQPGVRSPDWAKIKRPGWREGRIPDWHGLSGAASPMP